jgi:nucleotide-binding universal stress UspA family protein
MQHIIVPVDLSPNSKAALRYAAHIAAAAKVGITVVFAYSLLEKAIRYTTKKGQVDKDPEKWIQKRIDKIHASRPDVDVEYKIIKGDILDSLKRMLDITGADLIILGCQGKDENEESFLGSVSVAVVKTSHQPILLIPPKYKFRNLQNMVCVTNNTSPNSFETRDPVNQLKAIFHPGVHILPTDKVHFENVKANEDFQDMLNQQDADLLITHRREKGFMETILGTSRMSIEKFKINIPLLVLVGEES